MKKPCLILIFILPIVFLVNAKSPTEKHSINIVKAKYYLTIDQKAISKPHDTVIFKKAYKVYYVSIKFSNNTKMPLKYITMTCGWDELFHLNNKHFNIATGPCQSNYPIVEIVPPFGAITFLLPIIRSKKLLGVERLKVGMNLFMDSKENESLFPLPTDKMNNVIWSNVVVLQ